MLEPPLPLSGVHVDDSGADPFVYKPNTLYVWWDSDEEIELSPELSQQNFVARAVFTVAALDEEPRHRRRRDVSIALDTKRKEYLSRIGAANDVEWEHLAGSADWDATRGFEGRGFAMLVTGYRLLSIA